MSGEGWSDPFEGIGLNVPSPIRNGRGQNRTVGWKKVEKRPQLLPIGNNWSQKSAMKNINGTVFVLKPQNQKWSANSANSGKLVPHQTVRLSVSSVTLFIDRWAKRSQELKERRISIWRTATTVTSCWLVCASFSSILASSQLLSLKMQHRTTWIESMEMSFIATSSKACQTVFVFCAA